MEIQINPAQTIRGRVKVPGDKSISHRALMLAAIAEGKSELRGLAAGADVQSTRHCLQQLGVEISVDDEITQVMGRGLHALKPAQQSLDAGNSGTTMRLLAGILATQPFATIITGDDSLCRRPMRRVIEPLQLMGARIESTPAGTAPLKISGGELQGIDYTLPVASAQVKSCILFAGLEAEGETVVREIAPTRDHSERMLRAMGADIRCDARMIAVRRSHLHAVNMTIPSDFSSAAFFLAAAAMLPGSEVLISNINLNPTRVAFLDVLKEMGANVEVESIDESSFEPAGALRIRYGALHGLTITPERVPLLIDELPMLTVLATQAEGETCITGAAELRFKESDRLATVAKNLIAMGATVEELPDGLVIRGPARLCGAELDSHGDHRIAMAFAIAALCAQTPSTIRDAGCADISFPGFFEILRAHCH